jgi:polyisoprenoid-binding protein YceI
MARPRRTLIGAVLVLAVLGTAGFAGWWFLIRDDAPPPADIDTASETLAEAGGGGEDVAVADLVGDWAVDNSVGNFDDFSGTWAGYRFDEELASVGAQTAVGRTPGVTGEMTLSEDQVTAVDVEVDMTALQSDQDRRDQAIKSRGLETERFPTGSFTLTEPVDLPDGVETGERVQATATGDLTLHGVTQEVTVDLEAELTGDRAVVVGSSPVALADFDIEPPTNAAVLSVAGEGEFEFQVFFAKS